MFVRERTSDPPALNLTEVADNLRECKKHMANFHAKTAGFQITT